MKPAPWDKNHHDKPNCMDEQSAWPTKPSTWKFWEDRTVFKHMKIQFPGHANAWMRQNCRTGSRIASGWWKARKSEGEKCAMANARMKLKP